MRRWISPWFAAVLFLVHAWPAAAINVVIDYTYDTSSFFSPGGKARLALEAAAGFYSHILDDSFSSVTIPEPYESQVFDGIVSWELNFTNPSTGTSVGLSNATIAQDEYRIYAGARIIPGATLGVGGHGVWSRDTNGGGFTQAEYDESIQINDTFVSAATTRGESTGFASWGGSISFDTSADVDWHFDHTTPPVAGESDLFSVAIHELGHALGLGSSDEWDALTTGLGDAAYFTGAAAISEHGSQVPLAFKDVAGTPVADFAHWREGTASKIFGTQMDQQAVMGPSINPGTRRRLTALDAAALADIGWTVVPPAGLPGDFNHNDVVDAADYTVWRNGLGSEYSASDNDLWKLHFGETIGSGSGTNDFLATPEPGSRALVVCGLSLLGAGCNSSRTRRSRRL